MMQNQPLRGLPMKPNHWPFKLPKPARNRLRRKDVLEAARLTASQNEANLAEASAALRAAATTRNSLASRKQDIENRIQSANAALAQLSLETLLAEASQSDQAKQETEADFMAAKSALEAAEQALTDANAAAESALNAKRDSESHMTRLQAEIDALQYLLADLGDHDAAPIADQLSVSDGMETALAGYLADELAAPVGSGNQGFWREGSKASLSPPDGTMPLADFVTGAPALAASLAGVGVVDDASTAEALQFSLLPGQAIATKSGSLWRWDGFVRHANQSDKGAERIRQRRRLDALQDDAAKAGQKLDQSGAIASSSETTLIAAREHLQSCRSTSMQAEQAFGDSRRRAESDALKLAAGRDRAAELNTSLDELARVWRIARLKLRRLPMMPPLALAKRRLEPPPKHHAQPLPRRCRPNHASPIWLARRPAANQAVIRKQAHGSNVLTAQAAALPNWKNA
jgi:chromosome segregation protein